MEGGDVMERDELLALGIEEEAAERILEETGKMKEEYESRIAGMQRENEIEALLRDMGARNIKAVRALIDGSDAESAKSEIERLKSDEETRFLFERRVSHSPGRSGERLPDTMKNDFEARLCEARKKGDTLGAIKIKQAAAREGVVLV